MEEKEPLTNLSSVYFENGKLAQSLGSKSSILNLRDVDLGRDDLETLSSWLETRHHSFIRVLWGNIADGCSGGVEKIEGLVSENSKRWEDRPKPYYCAKFAKLAYSSEAELNEKGILPKEWSLLKVCDQSVKDGYFGAAFINHSTRQIVLAHRGTHSIVKDLQTDFLGVVKGVAEGQLESALEFTKDVLQEAENRGYRLGFAGHSLGGWLAQLTTGWCKAQGIDDVYAVTLDTPGAKNMLKTYLEGRVFIPMADFDSDSIDLTNYLSLPNYINCCNEQTGDIFHILPVFGSTEKKMKDWLSINSWFNWFVRYQSDIDYLAESHSLDNQLAVFDSISHKVRKGKIFQVSSWPDLGKMQKYNNDFFQIVKENRKILPYTEKIRASKKRIQIEMRESHKDFQTAEKDKTLKDMYIVEKIGRYCVQDFMPNEMRLQHFSKQAQSWLERVSEGLADMPTDYLRTAYLVRMEELAGLEEGQLSECLKFELKSGGVVVTCSRDAWDFRNDLERLLKAFPELHLLATDFEWDLSRDEIDVLLDSKERELIYFCKSVVLARLYLFNGAKEEETDRHLTEMKFLEGEIEKRKDLLGKLSGKEFWKNEVLEQIGRLQIMHLISDAFRDYKLRDFAKSDKKADRVLEKLKIYQNSSKSFTAQISRLKAGIYSLKAKIARCSGMKEEDLEKSKNYYLKALDKYEGLPKVASIWSNYGALLNNWGELCFWEKREGEALEKHKEALKIHEKAHELALQGEWFYQDKKYENFPPGFIRRDYARGLFLLTETEHKMLEGAIRKSVDSAAKKAESREKERLRYEAELQHILTLFAFDPKEKISPTTWLFKGIIYRELGDYSSAVTCFQKGLEEGNHATLLYRIAESYYLLGELDNAFEKINLSLAVFNKRKEKIDTSEERYREEIARELRKKIQNRLSVG